MKEKVSNMVRQIVITFLHVFLLDIVFSEKLEKFKELLLELIYHNLFTQVHFTNNSFLLIRSIGLLRGRYLTFVFFLTFS